MIDEVTAARFWARVDRSGGPDACWEWKGQRERCRGGYGRLVVCGKAIKAHRLAYLLHHGSIPKDMCVCHACDNPPCCNPAHLWAGTRKDNNEDKAQKGRCNPRRVRPTSVIPPGYTMSLGEVAQALRCVRATIHNYALAGMLSYIEYQCGTTQRRRLFSTAEVEALARKRSKGRRIYTRRVQL